MNFITYFLIFMAKVIENTLGTLRLIIVANGKKVFGAILQGIIAIIWAISAGIVRYWPTYSITPYENPL